MMFNEERLKEKLPIFELEYHSITLRGREKIEQAGYKDTFEEAISKANKILSRSKVRSGSEIWIYEVRYTTEAKYPDPTLWRLHRVSLPYIIRKE